MKSMIFAASFAALSLTAAIPALADSADSASCRTVGKLAKDALSGASGDVSEAKREARMGSDACNFGLWENGTAHYRKALTLLGK